MCVCAHRYIHIATQTHTLSLTLTLYQAPPGAQQLGLPDFRLRPHLGHLVSATVAGGVTGGGVVVARVALCKRAAVTVTDAAVGVVAGAVLGEDTSVAVTVVVVAA